MVNKLLFLSIFFSFAFLFRFDVFGVSIFYYQVCIIILDLILGFGLIRRNQILLDRKTKEIILLLFAYLVSSLVSFLGMRYFDSYSYMQYISGSLILTLEIFTVILFLAYFNQKESRVNFLKYVILTLKIIMIYGILQIALYIIGVDINLFIIESLNLSARMSLDRMGRFIRVTSLTWDTNYFGFYCLLYQYIYLTTKENMLRKNKFYFLLSTLLMVLTFSRTAYIGFMFIFFILLNSKNGLKRKTFKWLFLSVFVLVMIFINYREVFYPILQSRFSFLFQSTDLNTSISYRLDMIKLSVRLIGENPIFGVGLNNFSSIMLNTIGNPFFKLHNSFLQIGVEQGLFSLLIFIVFIITVVVYGRTKKLEKIFFVLMLIATNMTYDYLLSFFSLVFIVSLYLNQAEIREDKRF